jgi:very-short-patch-repair endonuclease
VDIARLERLAVGRFRLITRAAALDDGVSASSWHRLTDRHLLREVFPQVAVLPGTPITPLLRVAAAIEAVGGGALASHRTAAHLWGVEGVAADQPIDLILPGRAHRARLTEVEIHRPRDHLDLRPTVRHGIASTNAVRMLLDLGAVAPERVNDALLHVVVSGFVSLPAASAALLRHAKPGRAGVTALRQAIEQWQFGDRPPDSVLEHAMFELARRFGLPPLRFHPVVAGHEFDFEVVGTPVLLECDGWATHGIVRSQFEHDRVRDADAIAAGRIPVHFTWLQVVRQPERVARRIRAAIERWAPEVLRR